MLIRLESHHNLKGKPLTPIERYECFLWKKDTTLLASLEQEPLVVHSGTRQGRVEPATAPAVGQSAVSHLFNLRGFPNLIDGPWSATVNIFFRADFLTPKLLSKGKKLPEIFSVRRETNYGALFSRTYRNHSKFQNRKSLQNASKLVSQRTLSIWGSFLPYVIVMESKKSDFKGRHWWLLVMDGWDTRFWNLG